MSAIAIKPPERSSLPIGTRVRILAPHDNKWRRLPDRTGFAGRQGIVKAVHCGHNEWALVEFDDGMTWGFDLWEITIVRDK